MPVYLTFMLRLSVALVLSRRLKGRVKKNDSDCLQALACLSIQFRKPGN